ncbi:multiheme c-type cytochrome [Sedimenticola hydrogenitrophicus]|uniref:multiheme c-type cytochrome n=1 Tax=Sedimenticola hydrogenitrophicus TaxID=2967975 RepID=UPI0023B18A16|nr:multiheme c-type cytochrome [Sedimenticola hydrogenitrophicus]
MKRKTIILGAVLLALAAFLGWRFVRPLNIFVVAPAFERPVDTSAAPAVLGDLKAESCGECHAAFYEEWRTSMHSQAWTDPYFQADWQFDGSQQVCKNCHTPLDRQQEHRVLGFRDEEKWDPILAPNPDFDPGLQHQGVTCAACHLREGQILGPYGSESDAHPVRQISSGNQVCIQCHLVGGERWDTFFRFPPCGTVAEIRTGGGEPSTYTGDLEQVDPATLGCVECHMPAVERPLVAGGEPRLTRQHVWRGGHDPEMVRKAVEVGFERMSGKSDRYRLTITNVGAAHYVPTGTPDRHFVLSVRLLDQDGAVLAEEEKVLKRTVMWRPFIVDLWDTRLPPGRPRSEEFKFSGAALDRAWTAEAVVRYGLVEEARLKRIGYQSEEPTTYEIYRKRLPLGDPRAG